MTPETNAVMEELAMAARRGGDPAALARKAVLIACPPGYAEARPEVVEEMVQYRLTNPVPPEQYQAQMMASIAAVQMAEEEVARRLSAVSVPALILVAEHDLVVPPVNGRLLAEKIPGAVLVTLAGCGHRFPFEHPEVTARAIIEFAG